MPPELADRGSRRERLARAKAELEAEHAARQAEWDAKEARYREHVERTGRRPKGRAPSKPPQPEALFASKRNLTDLDSRIVRDKGALIQGYNAQAVVAEGQVIIAAQIINSAADGGQLHPMVTAARDQLTALGITDTATTVLADNGYWSSAQIAALHEQGIAAIVAPSTERPRRATPRRRASKQGAQAQRINAILATDDGHALYAPTKADRRTGLRPHQAPQRHHPPRPTRPGRLQRRMAAHRRHPQPAQALPRRPHTRLTAHGQPPPRPADPRTQRRAAPPGHRAAPAQRISATASEGNQLDKARDSRVRWRSGRRKSVSAGSGRPRSQAAAGIGRPPGGRISSSSSAPPRQNEQQPLAVGAHAPLVGRRRRARRRAPPARRARSRRAAAARAPMWGRSARTVRSTSSGGRAGSSARSAGPIFSA